MSYYPHFTNEESKPQNLSVAWPRSHTGQSAGAGIQTSASLAPKPLPPCLSLPINRSPSGLSLFSRTPLDLLNVTHFFLVLLGRCDQTPAQWFSPRKHVGTWEGWKCGGFHQSYARLPSTPVKLESLRTGAREQWS